MPRAKKTAESVIPTPGSVTPSTTPETSPETQTVLVANTTVVYVDPDSGKRIAFKEGDEVSGLTKKHLEALRCYLDEK